MRLELEHVACVGRATVDIDGITVIAGENNTGKSTVGRVLWSVFNSFYQYDRKIYNARLNSIERILYRVADDFEDLDRSSIHQTARLLLDNLERVTTDERFVRKVLAELLGISATGDAFRGLDETVADACTQLAATAAVGEREVHCRVLTNSLRSEMRDQINNVDLAHDAIITLVIRDDEAQAVVRDNRATSVTNHFELNTEAVYIDDPLVLDEVRGRSASSWKIRPIWRYEDGLRFTIYRDHRAALVGMLERRGTARDAPNVIDELATESRMKAALDQLSTILPGDIDSGRSGQLVYRQAAYDNGVDIRNVSAGMKTFALLKLLIEKGAIQQRGTVIMDEPEVHLHPEWQISLAHLIVLLQRDFNLHVVLTSHSPYFIRAIQVYAAKYGLAERCRYYLAERKDKECTIRDVTSSSNEIFATLSRPFERLETEMSNL